MVEGVFFDKCELDVLFEFGVVGCVDLKGL